jgi:hypothetical protein
MNVTKSNFRNFLNMLKKASLLPFILIVTMPIKDKYYLILFKSLAKKPSLPLLIIW